MFILREIDEDYSQRNYWVGNNYTVAIKDLHPKLFKTICETIGTSTDAIEGIVATEDGEWWPLHSNGYHYYIMTESGKTFEKINL